MPEEAPRPTKCDVASPTPTSRLGTRTKNVRIDFAADFQKIKVSR